jgi:hypothetical protein
MEIVEVPALKVRLVAVEKFNTVVPFKITAEAFSEIDLMFALFDAICPALIA